MSNKADIIADEIREALDEYEQNVAVLRLEAEMIKKETMERIMAALGQSIPVSEYLEVSTIK